MNTATLQWRPPSAPASVSHVEQAVIRLFLAVLSVGAILLEIGHPWRQALAECESLALVMAYVPGAALLLGWSLALMRCGADGHKLRLRLGVALLTDVFVVAAYTALSEHYAPFSLPVFMWIIAGYGWRFGAVWALAASALCMIAFALAAPLNPLLAVGSLAAVGYYVCFLATTAYVVQVVNAPTAQPRRSSAAVALDRVTMYGMDGLAGEPCAPPLIDDDSQRELRDACGGTAAWQRLVQQFEAEARSLLVAAGTAQDSSDDEACAVALHRLRGAAASMAAPRLERLVGELESDPANADTWRLAREALDATCALLGELD